MWWQIRWSISNSLAYFRAHHWAIVCSRDGERRGTRPQRRNCGIGLGGDNLGMGFSEESQGVGLVPVATPQGLKGVLVFVAQVSDLCVYPGFTRKRISFSSAERPYFTSTDVIFSRRIWTAWSGFEVIKFANVSFCPWNIWLAALRVPGSSIILMISSICAKYCDFLVPRCSSVSLCFFRFPFGLIEGGLWGGWTYLGIGP
jgi:hypothetical protein